VRTLTALLALALVTGAATAARAAEAGFSDVIAVGKLRNDDPPERIYTAAQAATDAYQRCSKEKLSYGFREAQHYADTRGAGLAVVAARALIALNRADDARRELEQWRPLVQQVVDWKSETQTIGSGNKPVESANGNGAPRDDIDRVRQGDHRNSMYRESAKDIVSAIDTVLTSLRERPRTQGRGSPEPAPSAHP
jgi:hypothetical protein